MYTSTWASLKDFSPLNMWLGTLLDEDDGGIFYSNVSLTSLYAREKINGQASAFHDSVSIHYRWSALDDFF